MPTTAFTKPLDNRWGVLLALLILYLVWGSTYLAIAFMVKTMPPLLATGLRFIVAGGAMYAWLRLSGTPNPSKAEWGAAARVGALLMGGGMGLVALATHLGVASGLAATFVATMPLWIGLWGKLWGQQTKALEWLGMGLGVAGVAILSLEGNLRSNPLGLFLVLLAPMCWALGSVWSRYLLMPKGLMAPAAQMLVGGVVLIGMGLLLGEGFTQAPSLESWLAWLYLVFFGSIIAYSAYMFLLSHVRPALATSYAYVNPVVALMLGAFVAAEPIDLYAWFALPVILLSVGLVTLGKGK